MCGRYAFYSPQEAITRLFGVAVVASFAPRYNICPTQHVPVVRTNNNGAHELALLYWGLVPFWAKEKSIGARMINARAETVAEKPAFRAAYRKRRCIVLADGYYEWRATTTGKQPYFIYAADRQPFAMAGLWESWQEGGDAPLESCAMLTVSATATVASIHDRMPRVLTQAQIDVWLDAATTSSALAALLSEPVATPLAHYPVSRQVNSPRNDGPALIEPQSNE